MNKSFKVSIITLALPSLNSCSIYNPYKAITDRYFLLEYVLYILYCQLDFPGLPNQSINSQRTRTQPVFLCILQNTQHRVDSSNEIPLLSLQTLVYPVWNTGLIQSLKSGGLNLPSEKNFCNASYEGGKETLLPYSGQSNKKQASLISLRVTTNLQRIKVKGGRGKRMAAFTSL